MPGHLALTDPRTPVVEALVAAGVPVSMIALQMNVARTTASRWVSGLDEQRAELEQLRADVVDAAAAAMVPPARPTALTAVADGSPAFEELRAAVDRLVGLLVAGIVSPAPFLSDLPDDEREGVWWWLQHAGDVAGWAGRQLNAFGNA